MASKTYYAWGPILYGAEVDSKTGIRNPRNDKYLAVGEVVTAEKLGIDDENFAELVASGAVRTDKFPDDMPEGYQGSPVDWLLLKARKAADAAVAGAEALQTNANEPLVATVSGANQGPGDLGKGGETDQSKLDEANKGNDASNATS